MGVEEEMYACIPSLECQLQKTLEDRPLSAIGLRGGARPTGGCVFVNCEALISGIRYVRGGDRPGIGEEVSHPTPFPIARLGRNGGDEYL